MKRALKIMERMIV
jgi:dynein intermediate chain 1